jgi:hypothetical protein
MFTASAHFALTELRLRAVANEKSRNQPSVPGNTLKTHDSAKLLFGLVWAYLL